MPTRAIPERRRVKRTALKKRASLIVTRKLQEERIPCRILDSSESGFRIGGTFRLKRGQVVEVLLDESPFSTVKCRVMWVGESSSKQQGEIGLQTILP